MADRIEISSIVFAKKNDDLGGLVLNDLDQVESVLHFFLSSPLSAIRAGIPKIDERKLIRRFKSMLSKGKSPAQCLVLSGTDYNDFFEVVPVRGSYCFSFKKATFEDHTDDLVRLIGGHQMLRSADLYLHLGTRDGCAQVPVAKSRVNLEHIFNKPLSDGSALLPFQESELDYLTKELASQSIPLKFWPFFEKSYKDIRFHVQVSLGLGRYMDGSAVRWTKDGFTLNAQPTNPYTNEPFSPKKKGAFRMRLHCYIGQGSTFLDRKELPAVSKEEVDAVRGFRDSIYDHIILNRKP